MFDIYDNFIFQLNLPKFTEVPLKVWRVSAEWILHSHKHNEWMNEESYEVDVNGEKIVHQHSSNPEENTTETRKSSDLKRKQNVAKNNRPQTQSRKRKHSDQPAAKNVLPKTQCPVCNKIMTEKALPRHMKELHSSDVATFACDACESTFKREILLLDHQRRIHLEPRKTGRPNKNEKKHRNRSPFRKNHFENRHSQSLKMNKQMVNALNTANQQLNEFGEVLKKTRNEQNKMKNVY